METSGQTTLGSAEDRCQGFGAAIDAIKKEVEGRVGEADLRRVQRLRILSRALEAIGRVSLHLSFEPLLFSLGVLALFLHKQLEGAEIGHTALHGAYDRFDDKRFHSATHRWLIPIDEESWRAGHNLRHHGNTNQVGKDPDIHFGPVRLTDQTPWARHHRFQVPFALGFMFPNFGFLMNLHFTGVHDAWFGNGRGGMDFLPDRSWKTILAAHGRALRKYLPYYAKEFLLFPLLAGPNFLKVLIGNWLSEMMRDLYSAATIYCGHVGHDVAAYSEADKPKSRGEWYARQVAATNNFEVSYPISVLCGGLDRQIEHHLFPKLAPERLREVAPAVRRACEEHGVPYKTASWPATLKKALEHVAALSRRAPSRRAALHDVLDGMA
jgi:linoleoyl-CoA desaturase